MWILTILEKICKNIKIHSYASMYYIFNMMLYNWVTQWICVHLYSFFKSWVELKQLKQAVWYYALFYPFHLNTLAYNVTLVLYM